jgi:hypothetical protein
LDMDYHLIMMKKTGGTYRLHLDGVNNALGSILRLTRRLHPYSFKISESVPPARTNALSATILRVSTYIDNDTWSTPSSDEYYDGNDPTKIV